MFERHVFKKLKTIEDYRADGYKESTPKRDAVKICFIDDKGFDKNLFEQTGYKNTTVKYDYSNPNDYAAYDIIACDIDGIGLNLDSKKQGLAVAETLSTTYPDKIILIYSSKNPYEYYENYHEVGDGYFSKNSSNNEIAKFFDKRAAFFWDEIAAWKRLEKKLRKNNLPNKTIAFMEDLYVRSLENKTNLFKNSNVKRFVEYAGDAASIISLIATIIATFI